MDYKITDDKIVMKIKKEEIAPLLERLMVYMKDNLYGMTKDELVELFTNAQRELEESNKNLEQREKALQNSKEDYNELKTVLYTIRTIIDNFV